MLLKQHEIIKKKTIYDDLLDAFIKKQATTHMKISSTQEHCQHSLCACPKSRTSNSFVVYG